MAFSNQSYPDDGRGMMSNLSPVVKWILIANVLIYFGDALFFDEKIRSFGAFSIGTGLLGGRLWEFVTFQFLHGSVGHLLFNSIGLFFFGPWMERWWGQQKFLIFYLLSGVAGALFFTLLVYAGFLPRDDQFSSLVGASAGLYGILVGVAVIAPSLRVTLLFPPVTLSMRTLALILLGISVASVLFTFGGNEGGEAGHLGGAIAGFLLVRFWGQEGVTFKIRQGKPREDITPKIRPRTRVNLRTEDRIDEILDKISSEGFQSLTDEERDLLQEASRKDK